MPPVKPNNQVAKVNRPVTRKQKQQQSYQDQSSHNQQIKPSKSSKRVRSKSKDSANQTAEENSQTLNTGIAYRNAHNPLDTKSTVRKKSFDSKPMMRDLAKRISNYPKQFTPQYFITILQFMVQKQNKNTISPNAQKVRRWRKFMADKIKIQEQVRREVRKVQSVINKNNKYNNYNQEAFLDQYQRQYGYQNENSNYCITQYENSSNQQNQNCITSQSERITNQSTSLHPLRNNKNNQNSKNSSSNNSSQNSSNNYSTYIKNNNNSHPYLQLTDQIMQKQWNPRFDKFVCLIDTIYEMLGQNQCINSIFPACYLFYSLIVSDMRTYHYLDKNYKPPPILYSQSNSQQYNNRKQKNWQSQQYAKSSPHQMIEYYVIVSLLISTKYHDIYPVSAADMIDCINYSLSIDKLLRIQCQVLEMLNFSQFFNQNQLKFLNMFIVMVGWTANEKNVCQFILQSGLNNPKLYKYSPLHKAAVVIGFYQQKFSKSQQKFMMVRTLCNGLTFDLANQIKKQYMQILHYNHHNKFVGQKKKFFIYDNQIKNLTKKINN